MVSVYRPCYNVAYNSAYMQQYRYSLKERGGICPRELLLIDLASEIKLWKDAGDSVIILEDFNEDVRSQGFANWKDRIGMRDVLLERIEGEDVVANTHNRGKVPIDTILCTAGIDVKKAGYLPFGDGVGDHRPLFIDVTLCLTQDVKH